MRTDLVKSLAKEFGPRHIAILVLVSDYELMLNKYGVTMGVRARTLKELRTFHKGINRMTMWRLVEDDIAEPKGLGWIFKVERSVSP